MHDSIFALHTRRSQAVVVGLTFGALFGVLLALSSGRAFADREPDAGRPILDATHLPPLLTTAGENVVLRYDVHCTAAAEAEDASCKPTGSVFLRAGTTGPFRSHRLSLEERASEGRHVLLVPPAIASSGRGFSYYAVFEADDGRTRVTLPAGGAEAPHRSIPLGPTVDVSLGRHAFGHVRRADDRVAEARWGHESGEVGLEGGTNAPPVGGSSFDVDSAGNVLVLDQVNKRVLRWAPGSPRPGHLAVPVDGTIADLSVAPDGTMYVLEGARAGQPPAVLTFDRSGRSLEITELEERTATQVRVGPSGPLVLQQPSGQWLAPGRDGRPFAEASPEAAGLPGRVFPGGDEVVVLRTGNEIRLALARQGIVRRAWRVTSQTPLAEVQLAEPLGQGLLVVVRVYTNTGDEFVVLRLGPRGLLGSMALDSADWAESAPLGRFRLAGSSLYQLGSTQRGPFVDRFDLEVT